MYKLVFLFLCVTCISVGAIDWDTTTDLDTYVNAKDDVYKWEIVDEMLNHPNFSISTHTINVTTHTWMTPEFSSQHEWFQYALIQIPKGNVRFKDAAIVYIDGGSRTSSPPNPFSTIPFFLGMMSEELGITSMYIRHVPNQPIVFTDDPDQAQRTEDDLIAYTWRKYIDDMSNSEVILQFPMTKGVFWTVTAGIEAVRAIHPDVHITRYFPAGGSKRGWITWLLGSVDQRVAGMGPIVLSCLNLRENWHHYYRALGGWSWALGNYFEHNITGDIDSQGAMELEKLIDPFYYNERLTMPKVMFSAVGDQFFMPDDYHYFYDALTPPKYIRMLPNAEHSVWPWYLKVYRNLRAMVLSVLTGFELPEVWWHRNETDTTGAITLWANQPPTNVTAWVAENVHSTRRDWRYMVIPEDIDNPNDTIINIIPWDPVPTEQISETEFRIEVDKSYAERGTWMGFFIEAEFEGPEGMPFVATTEVNIVPDIFLYPRCQGREQCQGTLK